MSEQHKPIVRFNLARRIEHLLLILSFSTLAVTGLVQKFPLNPISIGLVSVMGGIEVTRIIHRIAATVFLLESIYHLVLLGYQLYVQKKQATMMPGLKDLTDAGQSFMYNLGMRKDLPKMGRYNFVEKAEYLAMVWGLLLMALTGFMLWNPILTAKILPGQFIPAAKVAHGGEAVLAVLAIFLWHFYSVHIRHWNWSMIRGTISRKEMEEEHALELEQIEKGTLPPEPPAEEKRKRQMVFFPVSAVFTIALLVGVYGFVTFEESAITTVPPAPDSVEVFVPQTPTPLPTQAPATATPEPAAVEGPLSWENGIGAIMEGCESCHGALGGLALDSYADAMKGGASGPAIIPGDAENSLLVTIQQEGGHPGQFSDADLALIIEWIQNGALEK